MISEIRRHGGLCIFFLFLVVIIILTYQDYGISWDELDYINFGKHYVIQLFNLLNIKHDLIDSALDLGELFQVHLRGHGVFFDFIFVLFLSAIRNANFETIHLIKALIAIPIFFIVYLISKFFVSRRLALLSMPILLLSPRFYGDIFDNTIDIRSTLFFSLAVYYAIYYIKSNQNISKTISLALFLALAANERIIFLYLYLVTFLFVLIQQFLLSHKLLTSFVKKQIALFVVFIGTVHILHPYLWRYPLTGLFDFVTSMQSYQWQASVLFEGRNIMAFDLPRVYLFKMILITMPLTTLFLFVCGFFYLSYKLVHNIKVRNKIYPALFLLTVFLVPVLLQIMFRPIIYDGWRQFLFLTIPFVVIATIGTQAVWRIKSNFIKLGVILILIANLTKVVTDMVTLHPLEYVYYNELVGGLSGANGKYETDYWGKGYKLAVLWFNNNINKADKIYKIKTEGHPLSSSYYFKKNMRLTERVDEADYIFTFTRWQLHQQHKGRIIKTIDKQGVPLIYIIKT